MGPGMALKAALRGHFSLVAFGFAQVAIDIEPLARIIRGDVILHGPTHSYLGALSVALLALPFVWVTYPLLSRWWAVHTQAHRLGLLSMPTRPEFWPVISGLSVGTLSHVAIDSIMHSDVQPFWPFDAGSPLHSVLGIDQLHAFCVVSGVLGLVVFLVSGFFGNGYRAAS